MDQIQNQNANSKNGQNRRLDTDDEAKSDFGIDEPSISISSSSSINNDHFINDSDDNIETLNIPGRQQQHRQQHRQQQGQGQNQTQGQNQRSRQLINKIRKPLLLNKMKRKGGEEKMNNDNDNGQMEDIANNTRTGNTNPISLSMNNDGMNSSTKTSSNSNSSRPPRPMTNNDNRLSLSTLRRRFKSTEYQNDNQNEQQMTHNNSNNNSTSNNTQEAKERSSDTGNSYFNLPSKLKDCMQRKGESRRHGNSNGSGNNSGNDNGEYANNDEILHGYSDKLKNIRKSPLHNKQDRPFKPPLRSVAEGIPEVHFIGEISKGSGFEHIFPSSSISCKWTLDFGVSFSLLGGEGNGQTQYSLIDEDDRSCIWNHPMDVHFVSAGMQGWPRIIVQLWELDKYGRSLLVGFGFVHFPCTQGTHNISIQCWRPQGTSFTDELRAFFLGSSTQLKNESIIFQQAWQNRHKLSTTYAGQVSMRISTILRHFED